MEEHIQDVASHQHPDNVGMDEGGQNLGKVQELLENGRKGEAEPCVKLLLTKEDTSLGYLLSGRQVSI